VFDVDTGRQRVQRTGPQLGLSALPAQDDTSVFSPGVVVSPDGNTVAVLATSEIGILDPATLKLKARLPARSAVTDIAFSADSHRLAASDDGVAVWDLTGPKPKQVFRTGQFRSGLGGTLIGLSPAGDTLYAEPRRGISQGRSGALFAYDLTGEAQLLTRKVVPPTRFQEVMRRVSPDGSMVGYVDLTDDAVEVRDLATGRMLPPMLPGSSSYGGYADLAWRADSRAVTGVVADYPVASFNPRTGARLGDVFNSNSRAYAVAYAGNGTLLVGNDSGNLQVLDARSMTLKRTINVVGAYVENLRASPDGHTVLVQGSKKWVMLDYRTGHTIAWDSRNAGFFSPDGKTLAVVDSNGAVGFMSTNPLRWLVKPNPSYAFADWNAAFSQDGARFASSRNGTVGVWNVRTGELVGSVPYGTGELAVGFTRNNHDLVMVDIDSSVALWDISPQDWIATACRIAGRELTAQEWAAALPNQPYQKVCD
jgi:WD40 repeat protein